MKRRTAGQTMSPNMNRTAFATAFELSVRLLMIGGVTTMGFLIARLIGPGVHA